MAARLQKSTEADKFRFLNIALEKKYASQIDILDRQQMVALGQIFRERRKLETELQRQRNARLTAPIPLHLRGNDGKKRSGASAPASALTNIWTEAMSSGVESPLGMRRSASAGDLSELQSSGHVGNTRTRTQNSDEYSSDKPKKAISPRRKVRFEDDPEEEVKEEPAKQWPITTASPGNRPADVAPSAERIFDSTRAMAIYRRLQRKVQDSLEHGNKAKNPEAAVESTMKLMKRRQQRKMRQDQAEAVKKMTSSSSSESELRASNRRTTESSKTCSAQGWRTRRRDQDCGRSTKKEAYRLPSFNTDDESIRMRRSADNSSRKLEGRKMMERETKLYFVKVHQEAENKRVTKKIDDYFAKY